jgi:hypothetical protein
MPEQKTDMELLALAGDLGLPAVLPSRIDRTARAVLEREMQASKNDRTARSRRRFGLARRTALVPVALMLTSAAAIAGTGLATGFFNLNKQAKDNVADTPLQLFQADLPAQPPASPQTLWRQTVIPSTVHTIATPTIPGIGTVQYWVADTTQHGICTAIRLPDGSWAGLKNFKQVGGSLVGCRPTRAQLGAGALILSGFDYTYSEVLARDAQKFLLEYGEITAPGHPTRVRDEATGVTAPVIDRKYFLLVIPSAREQFAGSASPVDAHLVALNSSGKLVADEKRALPGPAAPASAGNG